MLRRVLGVLLRALFYPSPRPRIGEAEIEPFERLYERAIRRPDGLVDDLPPDTKARFLHYIAERKPVVFHGSNHPGILCFEPRGQTLYDGRMTTAVFASKDPVWSVFYAVLDKAKLSGDIRNGSLSADGKRWFHFYSLTKASIEREPWTDGVLYFLPEEAFTDPVRGPVRFNERICTSPVRPMARMPVHPRDFAFLDRVAVHDPAEPPYATWLLYKFRTRFRRIVRRPSDGGWS